MGDNEEDSPHSFDFTDAVERFKMQDWDLDHFCVDEMFGYFVLNHETVKDTPLNRQIYRNSLRLHILELYEKGEL
ncbi:hypothetical protein [Seonamhaeicola marinus]|uniref:Uncharacterized protein n=1 Tax=Seonamhaeicola marinus TaxID=1912246 RepID=A0A5D0HUB3_9FLAO|nr:hypothetical protein [Seonamhaeicola marinus]TYA74908.1 hypothetical protein FUA24_16535 [Seonamhaeicola marinus]